MLWSSLLLYVHGHRAARSICTSAQKVSTQENKETSACGRHRWTHLWPVGLAACIAAVMTPTSAPLPAEAMWPPNAMLGGGAGGGGGL